MGLGLFVIFCLGICDDPILQGAGHFVPQYKPREALQMIANFLWNTGDYSRDPKIPVVVTRTTNTLCTSVA